MFKATLITKMNIKQVTTIITNKNDFPPIREDQSSGLQVAGLSSHDVTNTHEVMDILKEGNKQRTQEPTAANLTSSRSHAVLIISVRQRNRLVLIFRTEHHIIIFHITTTLSFTPHNSPYFLQTTSHHTLHPIPH